VREKIVHRRFHVFVEAENDRVMLQIRPERLLVIRRGHEEVNAGPVVDVLQESDEGLALIGFAVAPGKPASVAANKMHTAAVDSANES